VRFKIAQQERFDVDHKLAGPWVRMLHFLDEEVFDRFRLNSIGQVLSVTACMIGIFVVSDGARNLLLTNQTGESKLKISDAALLESAKSNPSSVDEWVNQVFARALNNPEFQRQLKLKIEQTLSEEPDVAATTTPVTPAIANAGPSNVDFAERVFTRMEQLASQPSEAIEPVRSVIVSSEFRELFRQAVGEVTTVSSESVSTPGQ
jgi:hypothetical protein